MKPAKTINSIKDMKRINELAMHKALRTHRLPSNHWTISMREEHIVARHKFRLLPFGYKKLFIRIHGGYNRPSELPNRYNPLFTYKLKRKSK